MREILFRAKCIDNGEWVYGDLIHGKGKQKGHLFIWYETDTFPYVEEAEVVPETVGQYTGLTDKNGKKMVFEGDIVKTNDTYTGMSFIGVVKFDNGSFYICDSNSNSHYRWMDFEVEIIGNAFDNHELLEGET